MAFLNASVYLAGLFLVDISNLLSVFPLAYYLTTLVHFLSIYPQAAEKREEHDTLLPTKN